VKATGSIPLIYQWRKNGADLTDGPNISGATNSTLNLSALTEADTGTYSVLVTNAAAPLVSSNVILLVSAIDHFVWSHIPSPQSAGVPFLVSLQAHDANDM